jgi:aspartate-semialdehyde dehydrogenase
MPVGITRINVATYQAVSGAGASGIEELAGQTAKLLNGQPIEPGKMPAQIAFNAIPQIDTFQEKRLHTGRNENGVGNLQNSAG